MSAVGQKQPSRHVRVMSVIPLKADMFSVELDVCFVPITDIKRALVVIGTSLVVCEDASSLGALPISRGSHEKAA